MWLLYGLVMAYASTVVGPTGFHFVPRDPLDAWQDLRHLHFVAHGSDQRADWMGNLVMLAPFGFLALAMLWPRRDVSLPRRLVMIAVALVLSVVVICAIKYAQLFFPPRTVTLNYIAAQTLGALTGIVAFLVWDRYAGALAAKRDPAALLIGGLRLYLLALVVFVLEPLDFALSRADLAAQFARLPQTLALLPEDGRPWPIRLMVLAAGTAAFVPVGILLRLRDAGRWHPGRGDVMSSTSRSAMSEMDGTITSTTRGTITSSTGGSAMSETGGTITSATHGAITSAPRGAFSATLLGIGLMALLFAVSTLVMGAQPVAGAIIYRSLGIGIGACSLSVLHRVDLPRLRLRLAGAVPLMAIVYIGLLLAANGLLSSHWLGVRQAIGQVYTLGLIPLFDYYIVTKAAAAKNIVGHAVMYMPVGVMLWLRATGGGAGRSSGVMVASAGGNPDAGLAAPPLAATLAAPPWAASPLAAALAAALALAIETARYLRPGLEGDINAVAVAGLAAYLAARAMPPVWRMLLMLAEQRPGAEGFGGEDARVGKAENV